MTNEKTAGRAVSIRLAEEKDLESIAKVEKNSYPPELQASHSAIRYRFATFGIRVAELGGDIIGFYTCVPISLDWSNEEQIIEKLKKNRSNDYKGWFDEYHKSQSFNTLFVTSTAVSSEYQRKGIGRLLVQHSLDLGREMRLGYRASVLRVKGFRKYFNGGMEVDDYLQHVKTGVITNRILSLYLSLGFDLGKQISDYEPDKSSMGYGVFAFKKIGEKDER